MKHLLLPVLHGFALAMINIAAILFGFAVYSVVRPVNQLSIQIPVAVLASIMASLAWGWVSSLIEEGRFSLAAAQPVWVFLAALIWLPLIFVPLHLVTQGYLTSFGNIWVSWVFQMPVNALALLLIRGLLALSNRPKIMDSGDKP
jgi:hypothetical protein